MTLLSQSEEASEFLKSIGNWRDPNPDPVITVHEGIHVVRDDLLNAGTKVRAIDYIIGHMNHEVNEWVMGSCPAIGYAQISLPIVCAKHGKKAVIFAAKRGMNNLHPYQKRGIELGVKYYWVDNGMLTVTQKRARDYVNASPETRKTLPMGLEHPTVFGSFIKVARSLPIKPDYVWSAGSSGTVNRSLQMAWPDAEVHVVSVGHKMSEREIGRAIHHRSSYAYTASVKEVDKPPFPSVPEYDAKVWPVLREWKLTNKIPDSKIVLFWNVGG
jgi:hypothetical protein